MTLRAVAALAAVVLVAVAVRAERRWWAELDDLADGWLIVTCPQCRRRIEITSFAHKDVALWLHRFGCASRLR